MQDVDVVVIGAGFGGLAAALESAQQGARVVLLEALRYPGGCASTFTRGGVQFETGATLFSGLGPGELFDQWRQTLGMDVRFDILDDPLELRTPSMVLPISAQRDKLIDRLCALPNAPVPQLHAFFAEQHRVAEALWPIFASAERLPPLTWSAVGWHLSRCQKYAPLLRVVGRPLSAVLRRHGLAHWQPLRSYLNAISQITIQTNIDQAEAPFAMATMDYCFRGTGHVHGGIGALAWGLWRGLESIGGQALLSNRVRSMHRDGSAWVVQSRGHTFRSPLVISNLLPQATAALLPQPINALTTLSRRVQEGWGAAMLYLTLRPEAEVRPTPHHIELIADPTAPFVEGNHIFCSISGRDEHRAPDGLRTVTVSTHVPIATLRELSKDQQGHYIAGVQQTMRATLQAQAPELWAGMHREMTASPRTWSRFTRRPEGLVGGIPRTVGLHNYQGLLPRPVARGLFLVGDSVFPGQSTLATALGGVRTARAALSGRRLMAPSTQALQIREQTSFVARTVTNAED